VRRGDALDFIHPTFREYLAACALLRQPRAKVNEVIRTHWADDAWREVVLFLLCLLSDDRDQTSEVSETSEVSRLVQDILESGEEGLYFAAACLADQVMVDEKLSDRVVDSLLSMAGDEKVVAMARWSAADTLGYLDHVSPEVLSGLRALADDPYTPVWVRHAARNSLQRLTQVR